MTRIGMDVDAVRQTAAAIDSRADDLSHVVSAVDALIDHINQTWTGDAAHEFQQSWHGHDRGALTELVGQLHNYARTARTNADAQDQTSAGSGGTSPQSGGDAGQNRLEVAAEVGSTGLTLMSWAPKDVGRYPKAWANVLGKTSTAWEGVIKGLPAGLQSRLSGLPDDVLRYKKFGIVHDLNDLHGFLNVADKASGYLNGIQDGSTVVTDLQSHDWISAGLDSGTFAADELKSTKALYLWGAGVQTVVQIGKAAQQVDWSPEGMSEIMSASPSDWAGALGSAAKQLPGEAWKIFKL